MTLYVYVETNFLLSIATVRDPQAETLLSATPPSIRLAIPSVCVMEAVSAFEDERKRRNRFDNELSRQISQLKRDVTSPYAHSLLAYLEQSRVENLLLVKDVQVRLFQALDRIAVKAEMIELTPDMLQESLKAIFMDEPTDNLILHSILHHARLHPTEVKVLLSENIHDFGSPDVQEALRDVGVNKYLSSTQTFLDWLQSQPTP